ncbi:2-oxoglutarate dehydrogenase, mitochondrial [Candida viswanathii]|uniref:2-oxoglutarate dehydrogenase, mitochondrial n=1 Tax=Candida viswanathii TaxID=5486 RepID=A0A367XTY2_9ASCO|nr:2-oxoglutarate dehydrogenase, mitochondrial [Candida viswanathii]
MLTAFRSAVPRAHLLKVNIPKTTYSYTSTKISKRFLATDSFLLGNNSNYVDEMYNAWRQDPSSVHASWNAYFKNIEKDNVPPSKAFQAPPTIVPTVSGGAAGFYPGQSPISEDVVTHLKVQLLVRAYQVRDNADVPRELTLDYYGFTDKDLDKEITLGPGILHRFAQEGKKSMTLREIIDRCEKTYCSSYGVEYVHIPSKEKCDWLRDRIETNLDRLIWATSFEAFLSSKFPNDKRFGLEGARPLSQYGVEDVVIGMPHRGRLNMLSNVVRKPNESIFSEFTGSKEFDEGSGDVKYHLGMNYARPTTSGKHVNLSIVANPSHLEAEDGVVLGKTPMAVLLHGDAAFAAQGVVYETMGFANLPAYSTGGTIHVIVNNQIGFTTDPRFARSTLYPSDIAKSIDAPIFHVNADDVEACTFVFNLAAEWRATFHTDVIIDVVGYRKHGHNETDQPAFTQPLMYQEIAKKKSVIDIYEKQLVSEGTFTAEDIQEHKKWKAKEYKPTSREWLTTPWEDFKSPKELATEVLPHLPTAVDEETLKKIVHRNLKRILNARKKSVETGEGIDYATGEALAYGSLALKVPHQGVFSISNSSLSEYGVLGFEYGYSLTSPDALVEWEAQFGDFANTAQVVVDQFVAAAESKWKQRSGVVLSLPHGYDGQGPEHSSARIERYLQLCNEDQRYFPSPEKLERQHQDCNMQVAYPTTPANVFHLLRRQMHREFRKPLILIFSKSLLRHPLARSNLSEFTGDSHFEWIIEDVLGEKSEVKRVVLLSESCFGDKTTAFIKVEQLHPFPYAQLRDALNEYPNLEDLVWSQEEPLNMGAYNFVAPRIEAVLQETDKYKDLKLRYAGRDPSASVAAGSKSMHVAEEEEVIAETFQ